MSTKAIEALEKAKTALHLLGNKSDQEVCPMAWKEAQAYSAQLAVNEAIAELEAQGGQAGEPAAWINWSAMTGEPRLGWQCESEIASEPLYRRPKPKHRITYVCTACNFSLERQE